MVNTNTCDQRAKAIGDFDVTMLLLESDDFGEELI